MDLDPRIIILIVVPNCGPEQTSPMQGFSWSLCTNAHLISAAAQIPSTIYEPTAEGRRTMLIRRVSGIAPVNWHRQSPESVRSVPVPAHTPFTLVLLGEDLSPSDFREWADGSPGRPTLIAKVGGDLTWAQFTFEGIQARFLRSCDLVQDLVDPESIADARLAVRGWLPATARKLASQVRSHLTIWPNLSALRMSGFADMVSGQPLTPTNGLQPYVDQIVLTSTAILEERKSLGEWNLGALFRPTMDLNLFAPSIFPHLFEVSPPSHLTAADKARYAVARRVLQTQSGYSFETRTPAQQEAFAKAGIANRRGDYNPWLVHPLISTRQAEVKLATSCMEVLAASEFSAVVRLPNDVNRVSGLVRNFASQYGSNSTMAGKRASLFKAVQERLAKAVPTDFLALVRKSRRGVRIVSDAHLEWLDLDGVPLGISKNVTRIPVTPGDLFVENVAPREPLILTPQHFRKALIINAMHRTDPLRRIFEATLLHFEQHWRGALQLELQKCRTKMIWYLH